MHACGHQQLLTGEWPLWSVEKGNQYRIYAVRYILLDQHVLAALLERLTDFDILIGGAATPEELVNPVGSGVRGSLQVAAGERENCRPAPLPSP